MDAGHGSCVLRIPAAAEIVQDSLLYFHGVRYSLHAWVVMPNHFHVLFEPMDNWPMAKIVSSWKKYTASKIREYLKAKGRRDKNADLKIGDPHMAEIPAVDSRFTGLKTAVPADKTAGKGGKRRSEPFWRREFWDRYIRDEEHYYETIEYIHNNPVKARLVRKPEDWTWSSAGWGGR